MTVRLPLALLACLCLSLSAPLPLAAGGPPEEDPIVVTRPPAGETRVIEVRPGDVLELDFAAGTPQPEVAGLDLLLNFDAYSRVVLRDLFANAQRASVTVLVGDQTLTAEVLFAFLIAPAAGSSGEDQLDDVAASEPMDDRLPDMSQLSHSGRDVLFPGESERAGHPLYSYLLFAGASGGDREEHARFRAAIDAFIGQIRAIERLEEIGVERDAINIFYAPMKAIFEDTTPQNMRTHFASRQPNEQLSLLQEHYDYARAEVLLARMRLAGHGPYIVSVLRPLSQAAVAADEAFLVQDLSAVPPQLVALWVDEFKRQVVREATQSPEHLRRLALHLRTQIAVLAEGFAITKSAVAQMFDEPQDGGN